MQLKKSYRSFVTPALLGARGPLAERLSGVALTDARASREAPREEEVLLGLLSGPALGGHWGGGAAALCARVRRAETANQNRTALVVGSCGRRAGLIPLWVWDRSLACHVSHPCRVSVLLSPVVSLSV